MENFSFCRQSFTKYCINNLCQIKEVSILELYFDRSVCIAAISAVLANVSWEEKVVWKISDRYLKAEKLVRVYTGLTDRRT